MYSSVTSIQFALISATNSITSSAVSAGSAQECIDVVTAADATALAISFDSTTGACTYSTSVYGYNPRNAGQEPSFYVRTDDIMKDPVDSDCLTKQDGEYLIARLTFGDEQCLTPATYNPSTWLCVANTSLPYDLGRYTAGRSRQDGQDTFYTLRRDLALDLAKVKCVYDDSMKMMFGGTWYCYDALDLQISMETVNGDYCKATLGTGANPVKITETRELGFLYDWAEGIIYLGVYLNEGTTFLWYDESAATDLPWAVGRPLYDPTDDLVYVDSDLTVTDADNSGGYGLYCKSEASSTGFDPTARFT